jgi:hypothetical protein
VEAVQTSETLENSYQSTRRYNPADSHHHLLISLHDAKIQKIIVILTFVKTSNHMLYIVYITFNSTKQFNPCSHHFSWQLVKLKLCYDTGATTAAHPCFLCLLFVPHMIHEWIWSNSWMILNWRTQAQCQCTWTAQVSSVRSQQLTTWATAQGASC